MKKQVSFVKHTSIVFKLFASFLLNLYKIVNIPKPNQKHNPRTFFARFISLHSKASLHKLGVVIRYVMYNKWVFQIIGKNDHRRRAKLLRGCCWRAFTILSCSKSPTKQSSPVFRPLAPSPAFSSLSVARSLSFLSNFRRLSARYGYKGAYVGQARIGRD